MHFTNQPSLETKFPKGGPTYKNKWLFHVTHQTINCEAWNSPVEHSKCYHLDKNQNTTGSRKNDKT